MKEKECKRIRECKPEMEAKYRPALELYMATNLSCVEICRHCGVSLNGFFRYIDTYHCHLLFLNRIPREVAGIPLVMPSV
ncbi:hypothetical protein [Bacteroides faecalis]|uniref:hypothetical protein n=1 Tax=Bacteroides faecalis TaxID=2447885 RepID=UPI001F3C894A|nr:hypothetical protein [Bacteroides faecalis]